MKTRVRYCFIQINDVFYYSPKLASLQEQCVEVSVWFDESVDVYVNGEFHCEAVRLNGPATFPNGRKHRAALYPMKDEFPAIPGNCRCRSTAHNDLALQREMRRTTRRHLQLCCSAECELLNKLLDVQVKMHGEQMEMLKELVKSIQELRG
ncbi:hypothetical protein FD733_02185 [Pantoea sp. Eser]|nr:hypothetical protein [Pantoea sp. Eser]